MPVNVAYVRLQGRGSQLHSALVPSRQILGAIRHPSRWRFATGTIPPPSSRWLFAKSVRHGPGTLEGEVASAITQPTCDASDGVVFTIRRQRADQRRRRGDVRSVRECTTIRATRCSITRRMRALTGTIPPRDLCGGWSLYGPSVDPSSVSRRALRPVTVSRRLRPLRRSAGWRQRRRSSKTLRGPHRRHRLPDSRVHHRRRQSPKARREGTLAGCGRWHADREMDWRRTRAPPAPSRVGLGCRRMEGTHTRHTRKEAAQDRVPGFSAELVT